MACRMYSKIYGLLLGVTTLFASDCKESISVEMVPRFERINLSMVNPNEFNNFIQTLKEGKSYDYASLHSITLVGIDSLSTHKDLIARCVKEMHIGFTSEATCLPILKQDLKRLSRLPVVSFHLHGTDATPQDVLNYFSKLRKFNVRRSHNEENKLEPLKFVEVVSDEDCDRN